MKRLAEQIKISVAVPTRNEQDNIAKTIESVLDQTFTNFELLVSDNHSSDSTVKTINSYVAKDKRVRLFEQPLNIGAISNMNFLFRQSRGDYFIILGAHDLWSTNYLESLHRVLEKNQKAVCAFGQTLFIDAQENNLHIPSRTIDTAGMTQSEKFISIVISGQNLLFGLFRKNALEQVPEQRHIVGSGEMLLQSIAIFGDFVQVPEARFFRRVVRNQENYLEKRERYSEQLFETRLQKFAFLFFPHARLLWHYMKHILLAKFQARQRLLSLGFFPYIAAKYSSHLFQDVKWIFFKVSKSLKNPISSFSK